MQRLVFALAAIALAAGTFGGESVSSGGTESHLCWGVLRDEISQNASPGCATAGGGIHPRKGGLP